MEKELNNKRKFKDGIATLLNLLSTGIDIEISILVNASCAFLSIEFLFKTKIE